MTGVQSETQGEAEEGEPPYKASRSGDIVMVIDGETLCVPEEDVPPYRCSLGKEGPVDEAVPQTQGRWSEVPIRGQTIPRHGLGDSLFWAARTRGCAYSSLHQHDLGFERSAGRLFRGVPATEHYFEDAIARVGMTNCKSVVTLARQLQIPRRRGHSAPRNIQPTARA